MKPSKTKIIAEAGVNHNGSLDLAKKLIDVAAESGADYVKFQTFNAESLATQFAKKASYQINTTKESESQFEMLKKLELDYNSHKILYNYSNEKNIQFASTAFDLESIDLLLEFNIPFLKIPSGEITNLPYLRKIGSSNKPVILSTGMATLDEIEFAMENLLKEGLKKDELTILHCNTEYPTPLNDVNLNAMLTIRDKFDVQIGYSDHTMGIEIPIAAVALGATIIEKHFTIDPNLSGPDHAASLNPNELKNMVTAIRNIEDSMGNGIKAPSPSEKKNLSIVRKSIVAKCSIKEGDIFSENNITVKRPGVGISPIEWDNIIGKISNKKYQMDDLIQ